MARGAKLFEEILFYVIIMSNRNENICANQREANCHIVGSNEKIIYPSYIMDKSKYPIPVPRKWYRDENSVNHPIPAPRRKHLLGGKMPILAPRTKINQKRKALKGYTKSYEIGIKSDKSALEQLQNTRLAISRYFGDIFSEIGGFKVVERLVVNFVKPENNEENRDSVFIDSGPQTVINSTAFLPTLNVSQLQIMARIA